MILKVDQGSGLNHKQLQLKMMNIRDGAIWSVILVLSIMPIEALFMLLEDIYGTGYIGYNGKIMIVSCL